MQVSTTRGRTGVEQSVVEWLRVELEDPEITGSDNFLDIGGHSLVFSKLNKFLGDSFALVLDQKTTYSEDLSTALAAARPTGGAEPTTSKGES